jgi:hypothetical protein
MLNKIFAPVAVVMLLAPPASADVVTDMIGGLFKPIHDAAIAPMCQMMHDTTVIAVRVLDEQEHNAKAECNAAIDDLRAKGLDTSDQKERCHEVIDGIRSHAEEMVSETETKMQEMHCPT